MKKIKHQIGRPKKFSTPEELEQRCSEYFLECEKKNRPYGICGLAVYVGLDRTTLYKYQKDYPDTYGEVIKWARAVIEAYLETGLYGKGFQGCKFNLSANFGWTEKQENINTNIETTYEEYLRKMKECNSDAKY